MVAMVPFPDIISIYLITDKRKINVGGETLRRVPYRNESLCKSAQLGPATWSTAFHRVSIVGQGHTMLRIKLAICSPTWELHLILTIRKRVQECLSQEEDDIEVKRRLNLFG